MINYNNRVFKVIANNSTGETSEETTFYYFQKENRVWAAYQGGAIVQGHLLGKVQNDGKINMTYHHFNQKGELLTGKCTSVPQVLDSGKIRLSESWEWTSGAAGKGQSTIEEI